MLTQSAEDDDLFDSLRAGASGYLLKDIDPARLGRRAARACSPARRRCRRRLVTRILDEFRAPAEAPVRRASRGRRQAERARVGGHGDARQGLSTEEVASRLFLSPTTVRVHVSSVLKKLRVKDRESAFEALRETDLAAALVDELGEGRDQYVGLVEGVLLRANEHVGTVLRPVAGSIVVQSRSNVRRTMKLSR